MAEVLTKRGTAQQPAQWMSYAVNTMSISPRLRLASVQHHIGGEDMVGAYKAIAAASVEPFELTPRSLNCDENNI